MHVTVTAGAQSHNITLRRQDLALDPDDLETAVVVLLRYIAKTNNITTIAAMRTYLAGKTFKL